MLTSWATLSMSLVALPTSRWWQPLVQVEPLKAERREGCAIIPGSRPGLGVLGSVAHSVIAGLEQDRPLLLLSLARPMAELLQAVQKLSRAAAHLGKAIPCLSGVSCQVRSRSSFLGPCHCALGWPRGGVGFIPSKPVLLLSCRNPV